MVVIWCVGGSVDIVDCVVVIWDWWLDYLVFVYCFVCYYVGGCGFGVDGFGIVLVFLLFVGVD